MGFVEIFAAFFLAFLAFKVVQWAFIGFMFHVFLNKKFGGEQTVKTFKEKLQERLDAKS
jgi:hypothetical protein